MANAGVLVAVIFIVFDFYATCDEIAHNKPAFLSSTFGNWYPSKINDGDIHYGSCSHSEFELNPYIYIDLSGMYSIERVEITNRGDCCADRLIGGVVRIGESAENLVSNTPCGDPVTSAEAYLGGVVVRECDQSLFSRFVSLTIETNVANSLNLCEIKVFSNVKLVQYTNSCYKIFNAAIIWDDARLACENQDSTLLTINTEEERTFITNEISSFNSLLYSWTGLNDINVEGSPVWLTHDDPIYVNYDGASDSEEMDCFRISASDNSLRHEYCHVEAAYVCEETSYIYEKYVFVATDKSPTEEYVIRSVFTGTSGACSVECSRLGACTSFSFNRASRECQLSTSTGLDEEITDATDTNFYKVSSSAIVCSN